MMIMNNEKIINDLAIQVKHHLDCRIELDYSLLGQDLGCVIFLYYSSKYLNNKTSYIDLYLDKVLSGTLKKLNIGSYCNGLAGLGIGLQQLEKDGFIDGVNEALNCVDERLQPCLDEMLKVHDIDFLHGSIGIGFYLLSRLNDKNAGEAPEYMLKKIILHLEKTKKQLFNSIYWRLNEKDQNKQYNISLSHGSASVMLLLAKMSTCISDDPYNSMIKNMLEGNINYMLSQEQDPEKYKSYFPTFPKETDSTNSMSRLAWCYGDPGIGMALKQTAEILNDKELYSHSVDILLHSAERRNDSHNHVFDAELCHGAAGLSLIFGKLYSDTKNKIFEDASIYWTNRMLQMSVINNGVITFPTFTYKNPQWDIRYGILDGLSGIGLLLSGAQNALCKFMILT